METETSTTNIAIARAYLRAVAIALAAMIPAAACTRAASPESAAPVMRPSILLVTLDTTRADSIGPGVAGGRTPAFDAVAKRGRRFVEAYATAPETLPSHTSMMTGLYPAGHGVHENGRSVPASQPVLAERLKQAGYRTSAFVSSFVLARRFGLARGFDLYDDDLPAGVVERSATDTTDRALASLATPSSQPLFLWVHYYEPHAPYLPPEPLRKEFEHNPYLGEIAAMDAQLARLVEGFERWVREAGGASAIVIAGDHGEGLGDHGEVQHGHLLYQSTMRVPLIIAGPGVEPGEAAVPVSTRSVFHTILDWAGLERDHSLRAPAVRGAPEVVLGEAMKPYLEYGWQPQIMAVAGRQKAIFAGTTEIYDLAEDPGERQNLGAGANSPVAMRQALNDYPVPSPEATTPAPLSDDARRRLASLGYVSASVPPVVRKDAPRPVEMVHLFDTLEQAGTLFVQERYAEAIPLLQRIQREDAYNLDATLRLATAYSMRGRDAQALEMFTRAAAIAPRSPDVKLYLALHYARGREWARAAPLLEPIVAATPDRLAAVEALADIREKQERLDEAIALRRRIQALRQPTAADAVRLGQLAMAAQQTPLAIESFESARALQGAAFAHDLELGVLYLASRRFPEARTALERVPATHPEYPMALFKRAQVSVLLNEPDRAARIARARRYANATTRGLIEKETLFR